MGYHVHEKYSTDVCEISVYCEWQWLTLGTHAQRGLHSRSVCVRDYSRTTVYEAAYERYQQL